jgi:hypothetical protein
MYIAYADGVNPNVLMENQICNHFEPRQKTFVDVGVEKGGSFIGATRQLNFVDYDADGDLDLHVALRTSTNRLYQNNERCFNNVARQIGFFEPRRTVGACWFDMDGDGDLDAFTTNQSGDRDGMYKYEDGCRNARSHSHRCVGDVNNDSLPDLYIVGYVNGKPGTPDYLYINKGDHFENQIPENVMASDTDHGVQFADYDQDGDLDLWLAANDPSGSHYLFRNDLVDNRNQSIQVMVLNEDGHQVMAGSEVRVFRAGSDELLGTRLVDTGSGYNSQNSKPVHIATLDAESVDIEVTTMSSVGRRLTYFRSVELSGLSNKPFQARILP